MRGPRSRTVRVNACERFAPDVQADGVRDRTREFHREQVRGVIALLALP